MRRPPAVARVLERVTRTVREHEMFRPGDAVLVCVSGGPDSVCLLYSLCYLRRLFKIRMEVFHFDHRLRQDSSADAGYVHRLARRLRVPSHVVVADGHPSKGESVEAWARSERRRAAENVAGDIGASRVATAHTQDDQAQTVLAWALMGGGIRAIKAVVGPYVRPLIDVPRHEVEGFCHALHLRPREDPANRDPRFLRNALELGAIPAIERATGRAVREPLARTARLSDEDDRELTRQMVEIWDEVYEQTAGGVRLKAERIRTAPRPIARRLIGRAIFGLGLPGTDADVEAILDLASGRAGRRRDLLNGLKARREGGYVSLSRASPESRV